MYDWCICGAITPQANFTVYAQRRHLCKIAKLIKEVIEAGIRVTDPAFITYFSGNFAL